MRTNEGNCPSCGKGLSEKVVMLPTEMQELLLLFNPQPSYDLCTRCGGSKLYTAHTKVPFSDVAKEAEALHTAVPVVSIHTPLNWDYDVLELVTAQSVMGTGALSEFSASFSDLFGQDAPAFVSKIAQGERSVLRQMIRKTLSLGGNAVIAVDIDYAELGAGRGMIMVCATGTAINLKNRMVLGKDRNETIDRLSEKVRWMKRVSELEAAYKAFAEKYRIV